MNSRILSIKELKNVVNNFKKSRNSIVFTNGCFDILHIGHVHYLHEASKMGQVLIVAVNSDRSVAELKGPTRPIIPEEERLKIIAALGMVDFVTMFDTLTCIDLLKILEPEIYVKGGDYSPETLPEEKVVSNYGGEIKLIDCVKERSTSQIIDKIKGLKSHE